MFCLTPNICIIDAAAILQDERAKQGCRKFLQTGKAHREFGTIAFPHGSGDQTYSGY